MKRARDTEKIPAPAVESKLFCGFDWGRHDHYFVLKDAAHRVLDEGYFPNSPGGFADFFARLEAQRHGRQVATIIEATRGAAARMLSGAVWITLYPSNPSKTRKLIELDGSGDGKNDPRDSHLLCDHLIAKIDKLRAERERDEDTHCLRELVQTEDEYITDQTRLKNRIRAQMCQFCPGLEAMVGDKLDTRAYTQYLLISDPRQPVDAGALADHLRRHHVRREKTIAAFIERHRQLRVLPLGAKLLAVHCEKLRALVRQLHALQAELGACRDEISACFSGLPNAEIYRSQPALGEKLAPRMAAFFGKDPSVNFANKRQAAAYFGQSPVSESSGGSAEPGGGHKQGREKVSKRRSCNARARHTAYLWSRAVACLEEVRAPWQRSYLERLKARGDRAPTRYRKLGKKMIAVLYACLAANQPYSLEVYQKNAHAVE